METSYRVLIAEDVPADAELNEREITQVLTPCIFKRVETEEDFLRAIDEFNPDLIISDYQMPTFDGLTALKLTLQRTPLTPFILVTGSLNEDTAVDCMKAGVTDYVVKEHLKKLGPAVIRALEEKRIRMERLAAQKSLKESEEKYRNVVELANDGITIIQDGIVKYANNHLAEIWGGTAEEVVGTVFSNYIDSEALPKVIDNYKRHMAGENISSTYETVLRRRDGVKVHVELNAGVIMFQGKTADLVIVRDIAERKQMEDLQHLAHETLALLNRSDVDEDTIRDILAEVKKTTGFDAVAIRLQEGDDFPYFVTDGFSEDFVRTERFLCARDEAGEIERDGNGNPVLECMCGKILRGPTNLELPFFTTGGSFWTNSTTQWLASTIDAYRLRTRNRCNGEGYESVALIPLQAGGTIIGLLQLNDHRPDRFTPEMISFFERLAGSIGVALARKWIQEKLNEEKAFTENALNNLEDMFIVFDLEGRFFRWNKTMSAVTGYSDREIASMKPADFVRNDDMERLSKAIQSAVQEGSASIELVVVTKDGRLLPFEFRAALLRDNNGNPLGISAVGRDITDRKVAEEALRASERQYRQLVDNALVGVYKSSLEGRFLYVNEALAKILECESAEEVLRLPVVTLYKKPEDREAFLNVLKQLGKAPYYELEVLAKTGKLKTIVISAALEDAKITGMITDITERKHLEAQLRHAQKMEAIGTLAGGIAHDFNNILNVIMGYGILVQDSLEAGSLSKERMNEVLTAADRAAALIRRLLAFSRKQLIDVKPFNINELILGLQKMLIRIIGEDIDLQVDLADRPLVVLADFGQIEQVLMNLATNARDAMPEGGRLTICTGLEEIDDEYVAAYEYGTLGMYAIITVSDTGSGMDEETQKKMFEPFYTTKGVGEGTGLGLAISYGIIKQHGGYIKGYSEPGQGTVFKIYLPLIAEAAFAEKKTEAPDTAKGGDETILMAEDDASVRNLTRIVLESSGYSVITAEDGEDAIIKYMENRDKIALVILDMIMPKKSGKEVSDVIREASPRIKILFLSGYAMDTIKTEELTESGFDFIHKPVRPQRLLRKVREVLDR